MTWDKNIGVQGLYLIQHLNPGDAVPLRHVREFIEKENFAEIRYPVLRNKDDAVSLRVGATEIQNLNFFTAQIQAHAIAKGRIRHPCALLFRGRRTTLQLPEKAGAIVF